MNNQIQAQADFAPLKVFIIDDHAFVRLSLTVILRNLGVNSITEVEDGDRALALLRQRRGDADVVFCDLMMPGRDGIEVLRDLARVAPRAAVVLISGEDPRILQAAGDLAKAHGLWLLGSLTKPVGLEQVRGIMERVRHEVCAKAVRPAQSLSAADLARGLEAGEVFPYFQPKVNLKTRALAGAEALARWLHPRLGLLPPDDFIPLAESQGLIGRITETVLEKAVWQGATWRNEGLQVSLAVNLSAVGLDALNLPEHILEVAQIAGVEPQGMVLEITESRVAADPTALLDIVTRFRLKRFGLSIDDFGTGFSNLEQLRRLPFTEIKIDRGFVAGAADDPAQRTILESSIALGRKLGLTIVAEGVESRTDWDLVLALGCDQAQGFLIGKPMPGPDLAAWYLDWLQRPW